MNNFEYKLWGIITLTNLILDFGRPIAMIHFHSDVYFPMNLPSIGDYFHMIYNVIMMICLSKMMAKSKQFLPFFIRHLIISLFMMGATIHLVGDSVNHRLALFGYQHHLSLDDNELMKNLNPPELKNIFKLLYFYDEVLGHYMWYLPLFFVYTIYYCSSFVPITKQAGNRGYLYHILTIFGGIYNWYLGTEGQITPLMLTIWLIMLTVLFHKRSEKQKPNTNAKFLFNIFSIGLLLTLMWSIYLSNDMIMRQKYPGLLYVPEPWAFYSARFGIV